MPVPDTPATPCVEQPDTPAHLQAGQWNAAPGGLLAAHLMASAWALSYDRTTIDETIGVLAMGAFLSQQVLCAFWAAWAPQQAAARVPAGAVASFLLLLLLATVADDLHLIVVYASVFAVLLFGFLVVRWTTRWRLALVNDAALAPSPDARFSIRFLLAWTTVVAVLAVIGRSVLGDIPTGGGPDGRELWAIVSIAVVFCTLQLPPILSMICVLLPAVRWPVGLGMVVVGGAIASYTGPLLVTWTIGAVEPFLELWWQTAGITYGAGGLALLSAMVLRWAGYRVVKGA